MVLVYIVSCWDVNGSLMVWFWTQYVQMSTHLHCLIQY
jgi:hypothetical protein